MCNGRSSALSINSKTSICKFFSIKDKLSRLKSHPLSSSMPMLPIRRCNITMYMYEWYPQMVLHIETNHHLAWQTQKKGHSQMLVLTSPPATRHPNLVPNLELFLHRHCQVKTRRVAPFQAAGMRFHRPFCFACSRRTYCR